MSVNMFETAKQALSAIEYFRGYYASSEGYVREKNEIVNSLRNRTDATPSEKGFYNGIADAIELIGRPERHQGLKDK